MVRKKSGRGFVYLIKGRTVRDTATLARIRSLVIPPAWRSVWICPHADGHLQATGYDQRGRKQYRYHPAYRAVRDADKFGRMLAFADALPRIRRRVRNDERLPGLPKNKVLATVVSLLDKTCIRVGNGEYAIENHSFGLTTLRDNHVDVTNRHVRFHFRGKSGQYQECDLSDRRIAAIVRRCRDLPGHELFQYKDADGDPARITSTDVNDYLKQISGEDFTAKDFRTWHGTGHALEYLARLGRAESKTAIKRNLVAAVKATATLLGNRPATCRKYYIHPAVITAYAEGTIFGVVQTSGGSVRPAYERALKRLVAADGRKRRDVRASSSSTAPDDAS